MRISDWSSDVCSSDLFKHGETLFLMGDDAGGSSKDGRRATIASKYFVIILGGDQPGAFSQQFNAQIGRASCRERMCQYVWISGVAVSSNKKKSHRTQCNNEEKKA